VLWLCVTSDRHMPAEYHGTADATPSPLRIAKLPPAERPPERLTRLGVSALSAIDLLALLIGSGGHGKSALDLEPDSRA
jgi:uncharacterized protein UPF0758